MKIFEIEGFIVVLAHVRCVYPIEKIKGMYQLSFKFSDGFYETFIFKKEEDAKFYRLKLREALINN